MPLFQNSVVSKYLKNQNSTLLLQKWEAYKKHFLNLKVQEDIKSLKEEQYQGEFLEDLFVKILGYTKPASSTEIKFNLTTEYKNVKDSKKADGAIIIEDKVKAVIELKGTNTTDLGKIETQAFGYKNNQPDCVYVITSNFEKIRFYIDNAIEFLEFNLFQLTQTEFELLYLCLAYENLSKGIAKTIKDESVSQEDVITKKLYKDYSLFKRELYQNLVVLNPQYEPIELFKKSQKLLDRFLFIFFAEDRNLLPTNLIFRINKEWQNLRTMRIEVSLYDRYKIYFNDLNSGAKVQLPAFSQTASHTIEEHQIFAYNGGLFKADDILDNIKIDDALLFKHTENLSNYDFASEVDVNILGHIFENSLNELDEIKAQLEGGTIDKTKTKRKKDGVFYTPKYITKYIVENTIGMLCEEKKTELQLADEDYTTDKKRQKKTLQALIDKVENYRSWLLQLTICDPACGSGAFLNQALDFLIAEHQYIDELKAKLFGDTFVLSDIATSILENNLFGVDLNEESVEIAKLALWLRTAQPNRKLNDLNSNIQCGNSLIDNVDVAGNKAFSWQNAFPKVFAKGGFDVIIGNPPYGAKLDEVSINYYREKYDSVIGHSEVYYIFSEKAINELTKQNGVIGFIIPNAWLSNKYAKKLREILILKTTIKNLINFNRQIIFEDANVETSIFIIEINKPKPDNMVLVGQDLMTQYNFKQSDWIHNENYLISFASDNKIDEILKKVNKAEYKLSDKLDVSNGFKPYQANYGINLLGVPLTVEDVKNKIYHSNIKLDDNFKKEIKGKGVKRYSFLWEENYIKWGKWLMSPKAIHYFEQPKILVRQVISDYLFAFLDDEKYYADQSLYVCTNFIGKNEKLEYYTALLNSKLFGFYFRKFYSEEDDLFPKIKVNELKNLPIQKADSKTIENLSVASVLMIEKNKTLQQLQAKVINMLQRDYGLEKPTKKLETWYELSLQSFFAELAKAKIVLSAVQKDEVQEYFETYQKQAVETKNQIIATDKQIDAMVYELYGLNEEEIEIVENN
ncbi:Eco57I restriction-modification methylase domain-containing protein [Flavobacterium helocola]|uniref:site-specific DNA-methyltransferase (adenine-specific) n=1 Tax=Flavobacterium helocola TaxID=3139139 RepID=A0ABU9I3T6_9FLAO